MRQMMLDAAYFKSAIRFRNPAGIGNHAPRALDSQTPLQMGALFLGPFMVRKVGDAGNKLN